MTAITVGAIVSIPISTGKRGGKPTRKRGTVTMIIGTNALVVMPGRKPQIVAPRIVWWWRNKHNGTVDRRD